MTTALSFIGVVLITNSCGTISQVENIQGRMQFSPSLLDNLLIEEAESLVSQTRFAFPLRCSGELADR